MDGSGLFFMCFVLMSSGVYLCSGGKVSLPVPGFGVFSPKSNGSIINKWTTASGSIRACSSNSHDKTDGYMVSPFINTFPAKEAAVSVRYELKDCSAPDFAGANCKLYVELYVLRINAQLQNIPSPMSRSFDYVARLTNSSVLPDPTIGTGFSSTFTFVMSVDMKGYRGVYIAFRNKGACISVKSVTAYYTNCPAAGGDLINFDAVPAPSSSSNSLRVNGTCSDFSIPKTSAVDNYMKCFANGTSIVYGGCKCKEGFEMASRTSCTACTYKTYKPNAGNIPCFKCAANVQNGPLGNTVLCKCIPGFYRPVANMTDHTADCEEPPTAPRNVNAASIGSTWAFLRWEKPAKQGTGDTIKSYTSAGSSKAVTTEFTIQGEGQGIPLTVGIAVGISFFVLIVIAISLVVYFYRRRHPKHLQPVRLENGEVILPSRSSGAQVYVDPTTYQDLTDAVREFAKELDRKWIELETIIGGGEFGDVYKGSLRRPLEDERVVAIKTLKATSNKKAKDDFLSEAAYMGQFEDPNVIGLEGVIVKDRPVMIIIEFMSNGSLDSYLQENDGKFTSLQLLGMARGVSSGMTYLAEMSFIHRDLAARNILVDDNMVCKVADFGMSRELSEEETYNTTGGKIPVRWTAPEAIQYKKFTTASDVWSYGILLWEIMSYGERPYWDWGNYEVIERLASGYRLPPPMVRPSGARAELLSLLCTFENSTKCSKISFDYDSFQNSQNSCPKVVHDLMLSCWHKDRVKRPKFRDVRNTIDKWIRSPELLKQEASVVTKRDENLDYASMKTLKEWLDSIKLGQYIENFTNKGIVTPRQILELSGDDLKSLGILAIGHRNKLIKSINATKNQLHRSCTLERTKSQVV
eukprot:Seg2718.1 transcript_id=Seg2718.1/GoldUCD/mRNA.D3Y31 product="Ephrin type-A receptor 5" protein_id=Seg2718.1/GoldUCD/D3Y31